MQTRYARLLFSLTSGLFLSLFSAALGPALNHTLSSRWAGIDRCCLPLFLYLDFSSHLFAWPISSTHYTSLSLVCRLSFLFPLVGRASFCFQTKFQEYFFFLLFRYLLFYFFTKASFSCFGVKYHYGLCVYFSSFGGISIYFPKI